MTTLVQVWIIGAAIYLAWVTAAVVWCEKSGHAGLIPAYRRLISGGLPWFIFLAAVWPVVLAFALVRVARGGPWT